MRKVATLFFIAISVFLYATRFVCAAMIARSFPIQNAELFNSAYAYVGSDLTEMSLLALVAALACWYKEPLFKFLGSIVAYSPISADQSSQVEEK